MSSGAADSRRAVPLINRSCLYHSSLMRTVKRPVLPAELFELPRHRLPLPENVQVFASGANRVEEIEGFASLGIPVGVSIQHLGEAAMQLLIALQRPVMVDSGAFSEVRASPGELRVVAPITDGEWSRRLLQYRRLASSLGSKALMVVPDRVGSQRETLSRISRYGHELLALAECGSQLLLPLQVGELTHVQFFERASELARVQMIPAMPMRKAATSIAELLNFVEQVNPTQLHMLGAGIDNRRAAKIARFLLIRFPSLRITMDSNRLRAVIGKTRPLTLCEEQLRAEEISNFYGSIESTVLDKKGLSLDYTDLIAFPSLWARTGDLIQTGSHAGLGPHDVASFLADPDAFLQSQVSGNYEMTWIEHPFMAVALDAAWERFVSQTVRSSIRTVAIAEVFSNSRIAGQSS
jgi:hypothetical protein